MTDDRSVFTLASVAELPITDLSWLRVVKWDSNGERLIVFAGSFIEFKRWIHNNNAKLTVYTKVKNIVTTIVEGTTINV